MHTEICFIDDTGQRQAIEEFHNKVVDFLVIDLYAFLSEIILFSHGSRFVVSSKQKDIFWMF